MVGRTRGDQIVVFDAPSSLKGRIVEVQIIDAKNLTLFGDLPQTSLIGDGGPLPTRVAS
jgi:tRNA A37 methylthiotransferase MiaB